MNTISRPTEASPGSCVDTSTGFSDVYGSWWLHKPLQKRSCRKLSTT